MSHDNEIGSDSQEQNPDASAEEVLAALLQDLVELRDYLTQRGRHSLELAQRFLENARRNDSSRAYDERQATMLEYQHYIWHEIAGLVDKLIVTYEGEPATEAENARTSDETGQDSHDGYDGQDV